MGFESRPYYGELAADAGDETNRAMIRDTHELELDEPTWSERGEDRAPCPVDYLLVGVAGCQLESLRYCLERSRVDDYHIDASVEGEYMVPADGSSGVPEPTSNAITAIHLELEVTTTANDENRINRCLGIAEERGCIVSRTVEAGVDVPLTTSVVVNPDGEK